MKNIVLINDNEIRLNSLMDEVSFGKTNYDSIIAQQGIIASGRFLNNKYDFSLSSWNFSEVKSFETEDSDKRFVFYCGNADFITEKTKSNISFLIFLRLLRLYRLLLFENTKVSLVFLYFAKSAFSKSLPPNATTCPN